MNPIIAAPSKIGAFSMTILPNAKACASAISTKIMHCKRIATSACQIGSPYNGPNFQTRTVQPIVQPTIMIGTKIGNIPVMKKLKICSGRSAGESTG